MITHDTSTVLIPVDQIEEIKKINKGGTVAVNVSIIVGFWVSIAAIALLSLSGTFL